MTDTIKTQEDISPPNNMELSEFLEITPPNQLTHIATIGESRKSNYASAQTYSYILTPDIQLYCPNDKCNGLRFFRCNDNERINRQNYSTLYLTYICSNCQESKKTFSLAARITSPTFKGEAIKFGELPPFGPLTPSKLIKLIGPDRDIFLKGRRCESQGLGIGAFAYYRRVVENQKNRILEKIIEVSRKIDAPSDKIKILERAIAETQFSQAMKMAKDAIPEKLLVNNHNPLTLLHSALSEGIHELPDDECLNLANSIRIILAELSEKLAQALKDETELSNAISNLLNRSQNSKNNI